MPQLLDKIVEAQALLDCSYGAAAEAEVAAAPTPMPEPAAAHRISYAAAASKPPVGPKPSAAGVEPRPVAASKFSAGHEPSAPAPEPEVVQVSACTRTLNMHHEQHFPICRVVFAGAPCVHTNCTTSMPGRHAQSPVSQDIHWARRWTILPTPSVPPCRRTSPESMETRLEHTASAS